MRCVSYRSVCSYASCRERANAIKNAYNVCELEEAALDMAKLVPEKAVLVPAPSSHGHNPAMRVLSDCIASLVPRAVVVEAVVRRYPVPSSTLARRADLPTPTLKDHVASMEVVRRLPTGRPVVVIDNVVTTGRTIQAVAEVLDVDVLGVVYANASRGRYGLGELESVPLRVCISGSPLRVCVSGSRTYGRLDKVAEVLSTLPAGTTIVHGGAPGVDSAADEAAHDLGFEREVWKPDWKRYGKQAGPIRNREMVETCEKLIAFWDGRSRGTASAIAAAVKASIPVDVIPEEAP